MSGVELPAGHHLPQLAGQAQEAEGVRDRGAVAAHAARDLLLGEAELVLQPVEGLRLLDGVELLPLDVLDEGQLEELLVGDVAHGDRDGGEAGRLRRPQAPLPRDDLVALAPPPHEDRLHDAALADRCGELGEPGGVDGRARLERVRVEGPDGDLDGGRRGRGGRVPRVRG